MNKKEIDYVKNDVESRRYIRATVQLQIQSEIEKTYKTYNILINRLVNRIEVLEEKLKP